MGAGDNHWCNLGLAEPNAPFKSPRQTARLVTEAWVALHGFCPNSTADRLPQLPNKAPVADFRCDACGEDDKLKARRGALGRHSPAPSPNGRRRVDPQPSPSGRGLERMAAEPSFWRDPEGGA